MKNLSIFLTVFAVFLSVSVVQAQKTPKFKKVVLSDKFYAEGAFHGDFNKDGKPDVVAGPYWYEGPDFTKKHEIYDTKSFDPEKYSDNFGMFVADLNADGWDDVFICPHPGTQAYWYENPKGKEEHWKKHMALEELGNESQQWVEVVKGLGKGPIYNMNGKFGFGTYKIENGVPQWTFHQVSNEDKRYQRYTHGVGAGDINGDGRVDLIDPRGWWEQPEGLAEKWEKICAATTDMEKINAEWEKFWVTPWTFHAFDFGPAPSHILIYDFDGDGLNDVVCAYHCHLYGLCWFKQVRDIKGAISWNRKEIMPINPLDKEGMKKADVLSFSQMHAFDLADFNGDGVMDFVTGKRFWAHGSKGDVEANEPAVLYWFETKRDGKGGVDFIPHKIDDDSGVGTQVATADLNGDGVPDIIVCNKKGTFLFLSEK